MTFREKYELEQERKRQRYVNPPQNPPVVKWAITVYAGKILYDWWSKRKEKNKLKRIEKILGKVNKIKLDLYSSERDAYIVEKSILKFNEVLSSKNPLSIIEDPQEYEVYYTSASNAIQRSSPDPIQDQEYLDACIEYVRSLWHKS